MKMRKVFKRLTATVLALSMAVSSVPAGAETEFEQSNLNSLIGVNSEMTQYVIDILPQHLQIQNKTVLNLKISNAFNLNSFENSSIERYLYWVFDENSVIGNIIVTVNNGLYSSTFELCENKYITTAMTEKIPVAFVSSNGNFLMISNSSEIIINSSFDATTPIISRNNIDFDVIVLQSINNNCLSVATTSFYYNTDTPHVDNMTINSKGACWAACVASKVMNEGVYKNLTPLNVYSKCYSSYGNQTPSGTVEWIQRAYGLYGINITYTDSRLSISQIKQELSEDNPIHARFYYAPATDDDDKIHGVLISGIQGTLQSGTVLIMDPNKTAIQSCSYSNGSSNITYTPSGSTYLYSWTKTFY